MSGGDPEDELKKRKLAQPYIADDPGRQRGDRAHAPLTGKPRNQIIESVFGYGKRGPLYAAPLSLPLLDGGDDEASGQ
jgi:hypothetical protein